jgi:hypothetical protein
MKYCLFAILALLLASPAFAEDAPAKTTTVGGGIPNPWRNPYKTCILPTSPKQVWTK